MAVCGREGRTAVCGGGGGGEGESGRFGQVCLWIFGRQENIIRAELQ